MLDMLRRTPRLITATAMAAFAVGMTAQSADALSISLDNGDGPIVVDDNSAGDQDGNIGVIDYDSTLGPDVPGWHASAQAEVCSIECPNIALSLEADSLGAPGTLTFLVTETDFELPLDTWLGFHSLGGFTPGTVTLEAFWDPGNTPFATTNSLGGPFTYTDPDAPPPFTSFSADLGAQEFGMSPFSLTTRVIVEHDDGDTLTEVTSVAGVSAVPVPAALPLLVSALGVFGAMRLRRKQA